MKFTIQKDTVLVIEKHVFMWGFKLKKKVNYIFLVLIDFTKNRRLNLKRKGEIWTSYLVSKRALSMFVFILNFWAWATKYFFSEFNFNILYFILWKRSCSVSKTLCIYRSRFKSCSRIIYSVLSAVNRDTLPGEN